LTAVASALFIALQVASLGCLGYYLFLACAAIREPPQAPRQTAPRTRFAVVIPARNEALVLGQTLAQLRSQEYPDELCALYVVADGCTDQTAEVARQAGAIVYERHDLARLGKAHALQWLLDRVLSQEPAYEAVAIFDADSVVAPGFLAAMDAHVQGGALVLQGQHRVSNPHDSALAALAAVDMRLNNRLRNQSRRNLGLACRLMGDAMVFDAQVLREQGWLGSSLTEDREYGYELLLRGIRARYVPEAQSYGQAASGWRHAESQRLRWYSGQVGMQRRLTGRLLRTAIRLRSLALVDGLLELLAPSYSFMAALSVTNLGLVIALDRWVPSIRGLMGAGVATVLVAAWVLYPFLGLFIDRAPAWAFQALLWGPVYLLWRLFLSVLLRLRGDQVRWIRTRRREESSDVDCSDTLAH
jgi:cellulose synthase/poly-beta-1,6-N-acetylglucosamine synthase-like glycosyltransferase